MTKAISRTPRFKTPTRRDLSKEPPNPLPESRLHQLSASYRRDDYVKAWESEKSAPLIGAWAQARCNDFGKFGRMRRP